MRCGIAPEHSRRAAVKLHTKPDCSGAVMAGQRDIDRRNDARLLTPLLLMALVIAAGVLFYALTGHALASI
jgi:hypothetical protein